ncbi:hypothetical protein [Aliarcobacter cryaerophilus]|uniref:hypothetical protein n=1 Tax=Aliarcobacter cryaerophilus TaxID=28198 RepID=UPI003DA30C9B
MKINKITINNFKFYVNEKLETENKNILLYGENGSGKSSLFWALHLFYKSLFSSDRQIYLDKLDKNVNNNLVNHNKNLDAEIIMNISNINIIINKTSISSHSIPSQSYYTFHFLNHQRLSNIVMDKYNFYNIIKDDFFGKYILFDNLKSSVDNTISLLNHSQDTTSLNIELVEVLNILSRRVNFLLKRVFKEKLEILFDIDDKFFINIDSNGDKELQVPTIFIKVNGFIDFQLRINEARVKIIAISIYLALFMYNEKKYSKNNLLKVIVLDDILLSLDMYQRSNILKFIFKIFYDKYQFFIFTHDIYFYDLVKKVIKFHENKQNFNHTSWKNNIVFSKLNSDDFLEPNIYNTSDNYLVEAENLLSLNSLAECGNNIRKEIETVIKLMQINFEIGDQGKLFHHIETFTNLKNRNLYNDSHKLLDEIIDKIHNQNLSDQEKITEIDQLFNNSIQIELNRINKILKDFQWHRDIIGNTSSHSNITSQYQREFDEAIKDVKKFKNLLKKSISF